MRLEFFLSGFGIHVADPSKWGDETDTRIVGKAFLDADVALVTGNLVNWVTSISVAEGIGLGVKPTMA